MRCQLGIVESDQWDDQMHDGGNSRNQNSSKPHPLVPEFIGNGRSCFCNLKLENGVIIYPEDPMRFLRMKI